MGEMEWTLIWVTLYLLAGIGVSEFVYRTGLQSNRSATGYVLVAVLWGVLVPISLIKLVHEWYTGR